MAEFFVDNDAYNFEQQSIHENWLNPLLLNKSCFHEKKQFKNLSHNEETKLKMSKTHYGKIISKETKDKMSIAKTGKSRPNSVKMKLSNNMVGKIIVKNIITNKTYTVSREEFETNENLVSAGHIPQKPKKR